MTTYRTWYVLVNVTYPSGRVHLCTEKVVAPDMMAAVSHAIMSQSQVHGVRQYACDPVEAGLWGKRADK